MHHRRFILFVSLLIILLISLSTVQQNSAAKNLSLSLPNTPNQPTANITFDVAADSTTINSYVLGTNLPAWLGSWRASDDTFLNRTKATQTTMLRIPGGSWSNYYDWSECEINNACPWDWGVLTPTSFIDFLQATGQDAMYTINMNGTAKEAAALVAFFNGSINDDTVIGTDQLGKNWGTVSQWAQLRTDHGNPNPINIKYFEIGNEIYGGKPGMGTDCNFQWGWEDVWTCDGREYVNGIGSGSNHKNGFIEFRNEMRTVDSSILVGAVGVSPQGEWSNWGNEVIEEAANDMDFYIIHQYAFFNTPSSYQDALKEPQSTWSSLMGDYENALDQYANGRSIPVAITEHNLFSIQDNDNSQWMTRGVNMLFMADTIGQMITHGVDIANQWDLANGRPGNGTDYGLIDANTNARSPQYYVFPLWKIFGEELLPVNSTHDPETELSVYAGRINDTTVSLIAINKTGSPIQTTIELQNAAPQILGGTLDVAKVSSLSSQTATYNGNSDPNDLLTDAISTNLGSLSNPLIFSFEPYSISLLRLEIDSSLEPVITQLSPPFAGVNESSSDKTLTVTGHSFSSDCVVRWNGADLATTYASPTQLTAVIPAANITTPGNATITVYNNVEETSSNASIFTIVPQVKWVYLPSILK